MNEPLKIKEETRIFYMCDCSGEGMMLTGGDKDYPYIELAFFNLRDKYRGIKMGLRARIRWAWKIITTGQPWNDQMLFTPDVARKIASDLTVAANEIDRLMKEEQDAVGSGK